MADDTQLRLPPPEDGEQFERLCLDLWREVWRDPHAVLHGRRGHAQFGVDIYGWPAGTSGRCAIQCKVRARHTNRSRLARELRADVEAARAFDAEHSLHTLLIATTLERDPTLQALERSLDEEERARKGFRVRLYFWSDILELLAEHLDVARAHFPAYFIAPERLPLRLLPPPKRPAHYIPRADVRAVVDLLLAAKSSSVGITGEGLVGVQGMGGIGKSVLAAEVARDDRVVAAFPDGVFWLAVGQQPDVVLLLRRLAEALGDPAPNFRDAAKGKAWVQSLLVAKRVLLVFDDVWTPEVAESIDVISPLGRTLLTTRNTEVITWFNATLHCVELLSEDAALDLLAAWAAQPRAELPAAATRIARACGRLPLAIAMIGAMVRGRPNAWEDALEKLMEADLDAIVRKFPDYPYPTLFRALAVSVEALDPWQRERYMELAVFPREPIPETALITLWSATGLAPRAVRDLLATFAARSLAQRDERGRITIHDLQYAYVERATGDTRELHRRLVEAYRRTSSGAWHTIPDDGYLRAHLVEHCLRAELLDDVRQLFATDDWMRARVGDDDGDFYGYLRDLDAVWAGAFAKACSTADGRSGNLAWCIHLAFVQSTIASLAENLVPEAVVRGVVLGVWSLQRALVTVQRIPNAVRRLTAYGGLLAEGLVPTTERASVIAAVWRAYADIEPHSYPDPGGALEVLARISVSELVPRIVQELRLLRNPLDQLRIAALLLAQGLAEELHAEVLRIAVGAAESEEWGVARAEEEVHAVASFIADVPEYENRLNDVLDHIASLKEYGWDIDSPRATGIAAIAPALRGKLLDRAIAITDAMENPYGKACALAALAPQCTVPSRQRELLQTYVDITLTLPTEEMFVGCPLSSAVEHLQLPIDRPLLEQLVDAVLAISDPRIDAALYRLAPNLDASLAAKVITVAVTSPHERSLLATVVRHLDDHRLQHWFDDVLATESDIFEGAVVVRDLLPRLSAADAARLFEAIFHLPPSNWRRLVPEIPEALFDRCIEVSAHFFEDDRQRVLGRLSPRATAAQIRTILAMHAGQIRWADRSELELKLLCADRAPAVVRARAVADCWQCAVRTGKGWWQIADRMAPDDVRAALAALRDCADDSVVSVGVAALAPHLDPEQRSAAIERVRTISHPETRAEALCALALHETPTEAATIADDLVACLAKFGDDSHDRDALKDVFKTLAHIDPVRALPVAVALRAERRGASSHISIPRMVAMRELVASDEPSIRLRAAETLVADMQAEGQDDWTLELVRALVPFFTSFPSALQESILGVVASTDDVEELVQSYALVHPHLSAEDRVDALSDLHEIIRSDLTRAVGARSRDHLIRPVDDDEMDKPKVIRAAAALLPLLTSTEDADQLRDCMWEAARSNQFLSDLTGSVVSILRNAQPGDSEEAWRLIDVLNSQDTEYGAMMIERLAPFLDEEQQLAALDMVMRMDEANRVRALQGFTQQRSDTDREMPQSVTTRCIAAVASCADAATRYDLLTAFCRVTTAENRTLLESVALELLDRRRTTDRTRLCRFLVECLGHGFFPDVFGQHAADLIASLDSVSDQWRWQ